MGVLSYRDLMHEAADEIERLKKAATPICIGRPLIEILAREGAWQSSDGQCIVAADDLFNQNPYAKIERLQRGDK
jgi:hypothetical protein